MINAATNNAAFAKLVNHIKTHVLPKGRTSVLVSRKIWFVAWDYYTNTRPSGTYSGMKAFRNPQNGHLKVCGVDLMCPDQWKVDPRV